MATLNHDTSQGMFDSIVNIMFNKKRISAKQADNAKEQFDQFLVKVVALNKNEFLNFNMNTQRLDEFLGFYACSGSLYNDFWYVCKFIFTLYHGQSSVERGFNVNKQTMVENLEELGLTSLRMIYDELLQYGGKVKDCPIPHSLLYACQSAYSKYKIDLERRNKEDQKCEVMNKRKLLNEELNIVKKKKIDEQGLIEQLRKDSDQFVVQAGKCEDATEMRKLVVKANSFKKTAEEKEKKLIDYSASIEKMEQEIKNLQ